MGRVTRGCQVGRIDRSGTTAVLVRRTPRPDALAVEEPLEIRIGSRPLTVTMRTPGDDFDLVAGFLVGEGVLGAPDELHSMRHCATSRPSVGIPGADNVVD